MELSFKERVAKEYMESKFIPALHKILSEANPTEYKRWGGNACLQAAVFGSLFLQQLLPEYKWTAWEGIFDDVVDGRPVRYNHAWLYGVNREANRRLLVDLSRNHHERLFILVGGNRYPKDHPSYLHMKEISREKIDVQEKLTEEEYFTKMDAKSFLTKLEKLMK